MSTATAIVIVKKLPELSYERTWHEMQTFTNTRTDNTHDEIWVLQHPPVFTQGQAGKPEHIINANHNIPLVQSDRGGQITYHGPGQIVIYLLLDLKRLKITIRHLVTTLEKAIINLLQKYGITSYSDCAAPGIYVDLNEQRHKICSIGLRVRRGCTYHGLALNYNMDLSPFSFINPCGFNNLKVTQISNLNNKVSENDLITALCAELTSLLGYNQVIETH